MISIFAQTTEYTPPAMISQWLECAFWIAAFIAAIAVAYNQFFGGKNPQPFEVKPHQRVATHEELEALREQFLRALTEREESAREFREEIKEDMKSLDLKLSERTGAIFNEIRSMGREVSNLEGRLHKTGRLLGGQPE